MSIPEDSKFFIVYTNGDSVEDQSVHGSTLVIAKSKEDAISRYCLNNKHTKPKDFEEDEFHWSNYGILELDPLIYEY